MYLGRRSPKCREDVLPITQSRLCERKLDGLSNSLMLRSRKPRFTRRVRTRGRWGGAILARLRDSVQEPHAQQRAHHDEPDEQAARRCQLRKRRRQRPATAGRSEDGCQRPRQRSIAAQAGPTSRASRCVGFQYEGLPRRQLAVDQHEKRFVFCLTGSSHRLSSAIMLANSECAR